MQASHSNQSSKLKHTVTTYFCFSVIAEYSANNMQVLSFFFHCWSIMLYMFCFELYLPNSVNSCSQHVCCHLSTVPFTDVSFVFDPQNVCYRTHVTFRFSIFPHIYMYIFSFNPKFPILDVRTLSFHSFPFLFSLHKIVRTQGRCRTMIFFINSLN